MSVFIVDSSVGMKWFLPEVHADAARRLCVIDHDLHVPDFFDLEFTNILWKKVRRGEVTRSEADSVLTQLPLLPIERHSEAPLLLQAFDLANQTQRTVYDCAYLALAIHIGGRMVTADERLVNALTITSSSAHIMFVADVL